MNYYVFQNNWAFDCIREDMVPSVYHEIAFNLGDSFDPLPPIELDLKKNKKLPDAIPNHQLYLIFNRQLIDLIKSYDVDYLEEHEVIVRQDGKELCEVVYKNINVLKLVDVIDREQSELTVDEDGEIDFLNKLVLKTEFEELPVFRIEGFEILVLFREDLAQDIINRYMTGFEFYPANGFRV